MYAFAREVFTSSTKGEKVQCLIIIMWLKDISTASTWRQKHCHNVCNDSIESIQYNTMIWRLVELQWKCEMITRNSL